MKLPENTTAYIKCAYCEKLVRLNWKPIHANHLDSEEWENGDCIEMIPGDDSYFFNGSIFCKDC